MKHGWWIAVLVCLGVQGCESGSRLSPVDVTYRFDNVRSSASVDEWRTIREILQKRSGEPVAATPVAARELGGAGVRVSSYQVKVRMPSLRSIDQVQADLEDLAESGRAERIDYALTGVALSYDTSFVVAGTGVYVAGFAVPWARIELHPDAGVAAVVVQADSSGRFGTRLPGVPASGWVYGVAYNPKPGLPARYFRIDVHSQKQEEVPAEEYQRLFPPGEAGKRASTQVTPSRASERSPAADEGSLERRIEQEDEAYRRMHERADAPKNQGK